MVIGQTLNRYIAIKVLPDVVEPVNVGNVRVIECSLRLSPCWVPVSPQCSEASAEQGNETGVYDRNETRPLARLAPAS